jgi:CheY-like chemotaxis protein
MRLLDELPMVVADATQLRQVVINLVTNGAEAIAATGRSDGELNIATRVVALDADALRGTYTAPDAVPGPYVALQVRDNGTGIEQEVLTRIFEPFFTTKSSGATTEHGLGLSIVLAVVRGLKGVLKLRTSPGQGTEFELLFPCEAPAAEAAPAMRPLSAAPPTAGTVLVVDDDLSVREYITRVLRTAGYRVIQASSVAQVLALFSSAGPKPALSLAIIDWTLGKEDGEAVARAIHERRPQLPLVILSGYGKAQYESRLRGLPIAGTVQKPFRFEALLNLVYSLTSGSAK